MANKKRYIIRDYNKSDYNQIEELWQLTGLGGKQRGDTDQVIENTINNNGKFIILEDAEKRVVIGTSWITDDYRRLYLHHFGIHPDYQGKKLSKILLKASLKYAKQKNMQIKLEVRSENYKAIKLYLSHNFTNLGDYEILIIRNISDAISD